MNGLRCVLVAVMLLAGCAGPGAGPAAVVGDGAPGAGFACPKPGTTARFNNSRSSVTYEGAAPGQPMVCPVRISGGAVQRRVANFVVVKAEDEARVSAALAALFPLTAGKSAAFGSFITYSNDPSLSGELRETWTVIGPDPVEIAGRRMEAVMVERELDNPQAYGSSGARWRLWYAPSLGIWVKGEQRVLRGSMRPQAPFELTRWDVPAG